MGFSETGSASGPTSLALPQDFQDFQAGISVLGQACRGLESLDRRLRPVADPSVELAVIVAVCGKPLLQLLPLLETELGEGPVPVADQASGAGDLVCKKADRQRVFVGVVVAFQNKEVLC